LFEILVIVFFWLVAVLLVAVWALLARSSCCGSDPLLLMPIGGVGRVADWRSLIPAVVRYRESTVERSKIAR
jgi:hypothetical protein